jgi:hypothetical protein
LPLGDHTPTIELKQGDTVLYCQMVSRSNAAMTVEKIHSFTEKMVRLERTNMWNKNKRLTVSPDKLALYNQGAESRSCYESFVAGYKAGKDDQGGTNA